MPGDAAEIVRGDVVVPDAAPSAVSGYFEALNAQNWVELEKLWTLDAEHRAPGSRPRHGRDAVMSYFYPLLDPWESHRDDPTRYVVAGSTVIVDITFTGVSRSGRALTFPALNVFELENDKISKLTTWYDLNWLRKQI